MAAKRSIKKDHPWSWQMPKAPQQSLASDVVDLVNADEAIRLLKTTRPTFYRWLAAGKIKGMKVGRQWRFFREDIRRFLKGQAGKVEIVGDIKPLTELLAARLAELGGKDPTPPTAEPVERVFWLLLAVSCRMKASDVHLEPYEGRAQIRLRVDGVLHRLAELDNRLLPALVEQLKRAGTVDVRQKLLPQDCRIMLTLPPEGGEQLDLRLCFVPACMGESVTIRILRRNEIKLSLDLLDFAPADRQRLDRALHAPWGLLMFNGPAGSGKTTTIYSCLNALARPDRKIMTVEDPVEVLLDNVIQVQAAPQAGLTFDRALRAFLRSAPNVIMAGEIRDHAALEVAFQASLTGHLVLTTLHASTAAAGLRRVVDIGVNPFVVAEGARLFSAQRLVRLLCRQCSQPDQPAEGLLEHARRLAASGGLNFQAQERSFRRPVGCPACSGTGYRGRTIIAEMLEVTPEIGRLLREGAPAEALEQSAVGAGMTTLAADGIRRACLGLTTIPEVLGCLGIPEMARVGWGKT